MKHAVPDPLAMRAIANDVARQMKVLANPERLLLLCQLSQGERCVGNLEALLDIRQPTLSQQLAVLRREAVVTTRREGKNIFYAVADRRLLQVLATLYDLYCSGEIA